MLMGGCGSPKQDAIDSLSSPLKEYFILYVFVENEEQIEKLGINFKEDLSEESRNSEGIFHWDREHANYSEVLEVDDYPTFIIFNENELLFKSTSIEEVDSFLVNNEPLGEYNR